MKLSEEQLNKVYKRKDRLGAFLDDCAASIFSKCWKSMYYDVADLPDQDIINLVDWWKKHHIEQKYTIQVLPTNHGYLNIEQNNGGIGVSSPNQILDFKTHFTKQEIEQLKQRDDLAIDWDKAKIEPVEDQI